MRADTSLYSPSWYRVASLTPRLRGHLRVQRRQHRGERWYLLMDDTNQRVHRVDAGAWSFVGRCDGERSVEQIWQGLLAGAGDDAPTQGEVMQLLTWLSETGLVQVDLPANGQHLHERALVRRRKRWFGAVNPLSFRIPLGNPDAVLQTAGRWAHRLFSVPMLLLWCALVLGAVLLAASEAGALQAHATRWLGTQRYLFLMWLVYPPMKALHEAAHALAVRRYGGEVHEIGITVLLLTPMPYVDASASNAFPHRHQRAIVAAAGIMVELALAALALLVWLSVENGLLRDLAFVTMFIGAASTLLVNGNPLVRMDGYHVACDMLDLPNLAERSRRWWTARWQRLFSGHGAPGPVPARGETAWLALYAPASWLYLGALSVWIVSWLGGVHAWLGYGMALLLGWRFAGAPIARLVSGVTAPTLPHALRRRAQWRLAAAAAALVAAIALVPVPNATMAEGVVWLPEQAWLRSQTDGFVKRVVQDDGAKVAAGAPLVELLDDQLLADRNAARQRLKALQSRLYDAMTGSTEFSGALHSQIAAADAALARYDERVAALAIAAPSPGRLAIARPTDLPGRWVARGEMLGHVVPASSGTVRVALAEQDAGRVGEDLRGIELRVLDAPMRVLQAARPAHLPAATRRLPVQALGNTAGGTIVTDPEDTEGLSTQDAVLIFDLKLAEPLGDRVGTRVAVRFLHTSEPLLWQAMHAARQLLLRHFRPDR